MRHVAAEVTSYDAMPRWIVLFVKFFFDEGCDILKTKIRSVKENSITTACLVSTIVLNPIKLYVYMNQ